MESWTTSRQYFNMSLERQVVKNSLVSKVKARMSFLFTEGSLNVENKEHLFDFNVTLYLYHLLTKDPFIIKSLRLEDH